jgi:hypothetical protein
MNETPIDHDVKEYLDSYKVDLPDEDEMEGSIEFIMSQVIVQETRSENILRKVKSLLLNSTQEVTNFSWTFWGMNGLFLLLGIISLVEWKANPYLTVFALAPLPFIVGILEILKSKDEGLIELEMTLKYNAQQIITSRLLVIGLYNFLVNMLLTLISTSIYPEVLFSQLLLSWTVPYVLVTGIAFLFALYMRGIVASGSVLAVWFAACYAGVQVSGVTDFIVNMGGLPAAGLILAGILLWTVHIEKIRRIGIGRENYEA